MATRLPSLCLAMRAFLAAIAFVAGVSAVPAHALTSQFLGADPSAAQVMAGTPYDLAAASWRLGDGKIDRSTFAYKLHSAFLMLGYQTEMGSGWGLDDARLRCLHLFQGRAGLPVSDAIDAAALAQLDAELAAREAVLAPLSATFLLGAHMQPLHANDASRDTVAAIYALATNVLPPALRPGENEFIQCTSFQCVGEIQDAAGTPIYANYGQGNAWIDPSSDYRFVGAYFDLRKDMGRRPSAAVDVATALHEYAHYLDGSFGRAYAPSSFPAVVPLWRSLDTTAFYAIGYDLATDANGCFTRRSEDPLDWISKYAYDPGYGGCAAGKHVPAEDFAESFAFYVTAGRNFRSAAAGRPMIAQRYAWLRTNVFAGMEFDTDLPGDASSGCNDVRGTESQLPGYIQCNDNYAWDFTLPQSLVAGACGSANGASSWIAPSANLCSSGLPSAVTGTGPWNWTCDGLNGGAPAACTASPAAVPSPPLGVTAVAGDAQAAVSFSAPTHAGASAIQSYTVTSSPGGFTASGASSPLTVTGLANGTGYTFTVTASNAGGASAPSAASATVWPSGLPGAPVIGTATPGVGSASVSFSAPASTGGSAITGYTVTSSPGGLTASGGASPLVVTGLSATPYTFTVRANNVHGAGPPSAASNSVLPAGLLLPVETFDATLTPTLPPGWQSIIGTHADGAWATYAGTRNPAGASAHSGGHVVYFNSHDAAAGGSAWLVSPAFSLSGVSGAKLAFWMYRDLADAMADRVDVYVNSAPTIGGASLLGTVHRMKNFAPAAPAVGWQRFVYDIPAGYSGTALHVIFNGWSAGGGSDVHLDDIVVARLPGAPAITAVTPASGSLTVSFTPPASDGGAAITSYTATCVGGSTFSASGAGSPVVILGVANAGTYSCTVAADNAVGTGPSSASVSAPGVVAPAFTSSASAQFTVMSAGQFNVTASAIPAATLSLSGALPAGLFFEPSCGVIWGTPAPGTAGTYSLTVTASNGVPPAAQAVLSLTVQKMAQTVELPMTPQVSVGRTTFIASYATSNLDVTVQSLTPSVCTVADSWQLTAVSAGTCTLVADQPGNADFAPAPRASLNFAIAAGVPLPPTAVSARPGNGQVVLTFSPPGNDGGLSVTGYTASCGPGNAVASGIASPLVVPGLANGATVACTVVANNATGTGDPSWVLLATPGPSAGPHALVTNTGTGNVSAIEIATRRVVATLAAGERPLGIAFEPAGTRAWVTDNAEGSIRAIDLATWSVSAPVAVGPYAYGIAIHPTAPLAAVTLQSEGEVALVNLSTRAVQRIAVGLSPSGVAFDASGARLLVANSGASTMSVIDVASRTVVRTIVVGSGPIGLAIHPAGTLAYTANFDDGSYSAIDLASWTVTTAPVGLDAYAVAVDPSGSQAYVTGLSDGSMSVVDTATQAVVRTVHGLFAPVGVDATGGSAYVVDAGGPSLRVVDPTGESAMRTVDLVEPYATPAGFGKFIQPMVAPAPPPPATMTLSVAFAGTGSGTVSSNPSGASCGTSCSASFSPGATVSLVASPAGGSVFTGWSGACAGTGTCAVTMDAARDVTATFGLATEIPRLGNISTRMQVLTGNDVLIGGFIVGGTQPKTLVIRARGPSLVPLGIANALANPVLQLFSGATVIAQNDDWGQAANAAAIQASGFAPGNSREAAILVTLGPGAYTAIVSGAGGTTGVGIIEVFEVDHPEIPLVNIATRGQVLTGGDVMIAGFVIQGAQPKTVAIRARGPSLASQGVTGALQDPRLQLFAGQAEIASNNDWGSAANAAQVQASGFAPPDARESVILVTLNPGAYTAIVTGVGGTTGVAIVEVFGL